MQTGSDVIVLGAGMSGLGAALSLQAPAYEAGSHPGGVCYSFYVDLNGDIRDPLQEDVSACFRFEPAGGHWMFGLQGPKLELLARFASFDAHTRRAAVFFPEQGWLVPFPVQDHLRFFPPRVRERVLREMLAPPQPDVCVTFKDWLLSRFGPTLCELFFYPFNERYTAGLYANVAPQDAYKSPTADRRIVEGALAGGPPNRGYNVVFHYPTGGLDQLVRALAGAGRVLCNHPVAYIDTERRTLGFVGGEKVEYRQIVSSIPLHHMLELCGSHSDARGDPATAVLVVNIAAEVGRECPPHHWVYVANSSSRIHRVGFYSHVDRGFLPKSSRKDVVSLYAERSFPGSHTLSGAESNQVCREVVEELRSWGFIGEPLAVHATFTDPAYTWSWPGSTWVEEARRTLLGCGIRQIGRYGGWRFQGMADSFHEGWSVARFYRNV